MYARAFYRTEAPSVKAHLEAQERSLETYLTKVKEFQASYPGFLTVEWRGNDGSRALMGLMYEGKVTSPGPLWSQKGSDRFWYPRNNCSAGKAINKQLATIKHSVQTIPGMPNRLHTKQSTVHWPSLDLLDGAIWVSWDAPPALVEQHEHFSPVIWTRQKQSAFWLAYEAEHPEEETECQDAE